MEPELESAMVALQRGDRAGALSALRAASAAGSLHASFNLGALLHGADGGPVDAAGSSLAYARCVELGTAAASARGFGAALAGQRKELFLQAVHALKAVFAEREARPRHFSCALVGSVPSPHALAPSWRPMPPKRQRWRRRCAAPRA